MLDSSRAMGMLFISRTHRGEVQKSSENFFELRFVAEGGVEVRFLRHRAWVLSSLATVIAGWSCFWWSGRPERQLAEAERCLALDDFGGVLSSLELPEATARTRDRALLLRARAALARGRPADAVQPLGAIDPNGPCSIDASFWKGRTLLAVGQYRRAIDWLRSVVDRRPDDAESRRWLAAASYESGDRRTALAELRQVIRLVPEDPRAWRTVALLLKEDVETEQAREAYSTALRLDPSQPQVRLEFAEVLITSGRYDEAGSQLEACSGLVPEADRLDLLARILLDRGERDRLLALLERALEQYPTHVGLLNQRAKIEVSEGRTAEAIALLDRALEVDPYHAASYHQRGLLRKASGDAEGAARDLARSSELNADLAAMSRLDDEAGRRPEDAEIRVEIGQLCAQLGKFDLAASWYRAALAIDPGNIAARSAIGALKAR
jgi:tetratricopeptide (TPR) repeat protein